MHTVHGAIVEMMIIMVVVIIMIAIIMIVGILIMPSSDMCESAARMCVLMKQKVYMK